MTSLYKKKGGGGVYNFARSIDSDNSSRTRSRGANEIIYSTMKSTECKNRMIPLTFLRSTVLIKPCDVSPSLSLSGETNSAKFLR